MKWVIGVGVIAVGALLTWQLAARGRRPQPPPPAVVVAMSTDAAVQRAEPLEAVIADAGMARPATPPAPVPATVDASVQKPTPLPTAPTKVSRRSPEAWNAVTPIIGRWFTGRDVAKATQTLQDACQNMESIGADAVGQGIENMRDGGVFDSKLFHEALDERNKTMDELLKDLGALSHGKFGRGELRELYETTAFSRACPTLGMNHADDDDDD